MGTTSGTVAQHRSLRTILIVALLALTPLVTWSGRSFRHSGAFDRFRNPNDFRAFYCAGKVLLSGRDPYRVEPLRSCEDSASLAERTVQFAGLVIPAPLPPYALASIGLTGLLPYPNAVALWYWMLLLATIATAAILRNLTTLPAAFLALLWALLSVSAILLGQVVPICAVALVAAARSLRNRRFGAASLALACTMIEPHIGLPSYLALFIWKRDARKTLLMCAAGLGVLTFLVAGPSLTIEYFLKVLPGHARSEVAAIQSQYSLTTVLAALGFSPDAAIGWGTLDYATMCALGVFVAGRLARREGDDALVALVAPAFALLGGPYVHGYQLALGAPAMLVSFASLRAHRASRFVTTAVALGVLGIAASSVLEALFAGELARRGNAPAVAALAHLHGDDLASTNSLVWHAFERPRDYGAIVGVWLIKLPAIAGLATFAVTATVLCLNFPRTVSRPEMESKLPA